MSTKIPDKKLLDILEQTSTHLSALHKQWSPHAGQIEAGKFLFNDKVRTLWLQTGRRWGKSEFAMYCAWRKAITCPGSTSYVIAPNRRQVSRIYWDSGRIKYFGPREALLDGKDGIRETILSLCFRNGSRIVVDGSEQYDSLRGITADFVVFDEFRDFHAEAWDAIYPSLASTGGSLLIISTPPNREGFYINRRQWLMEESQKSQKYQYIEQPTYKNPHVPMDWLSEEKEQYRKRGEEAAWKREFLAEYVPGGALAVFPMFNRKEHSYPAHTLQALTKRDKRKLDWYVILDPATETVFGGLVVAINRFTSQVYVFDEIYERNRIYMTTNQIWNRVQKLTRKYNDDDDAWIYIYDSAAAWFANEVNDRFGVALTPTNKAVSRKEESMSLIKDALIAEKKILISRDCYWLMHEVENYVTDEEGRFIKKDDHLIDCWRYLFNFASYSLNEEVSNTPKREKRFISLEQDMYQWRAEKDWTANIDTGDSTEDYEIDDELWMN